MKELYGLSPAQMAEVYCACVYKDCLDEIHGRLYEGNYGEEMRKQGIPDLTVDEINEAAKWLQENILAYTHWVDGGEDAIDYVLAKRPPKEEPKPDPEPPDAYYRKVLEMYGLIDGDTFKIKGIPHIYHFDGGDLFYTEGLEDEIATLSNYTLAQFLFEFKKEDIELVKPEPKDLLNDTLKMIGLETNQFFRINDDEFSGDDFYIDSFGDVYIACWSPEEPDIRNSYLDTVHDHLTLGRILTQYHDKIVPWDTKEYGYA